MLPAGPRKPDVCGEEAHFVATVKNEWPAIIILNAAKAAIR
jgi:hypothetical protein